MKIYNENHPSNRTSTMLSRMYINLNHTTKQNVKNETGQARDIIIKRPLTTHTKIWGRKSCLEQCCTSNLQFSNSCPDLRITSKEMLWALQSLAFEILSRQERCSSKKLKFIQQKWGVLSHFVFKYILSMYLLTYNAPNISNQSKTSYSLYVQKTNSHWAQSKNIYNRCCLTWIVQLLNHELLLIMMVHSTFRQIKSAPQTAGFRISN